MERQINDQTDRQTDRQIDKQMDRQIDRQIGRQVEVEKTRELYIGEIKRERGKLAETDKHEHKD